MEGLKQGFYPDLSNEAYHADPAIGSSGLKLFAECPALYYHTYINPFMEKKESSAMAFGTAAHISLLEPEKFKQEYIVLEDPEVDKKTVKAWKQFEMFAEGEGKKPLLWKEYNRLCFMTASIRKHSLANAMLSKGRPEMSFFAQDPDTEIMCKARPDYLVKLDGYGVVLVDYKTTGLPLGTSKQSNHAFSLDRQVQAAHHKAVTELATGGKINEVVYIVQMQEPPFLIRIFRMPEEALQLGEDHRRASLLGMKDCLDTGVFQDYPETIEDYLMPRWLQHQYV